MFGGLWFLEFIYVCVDRYTSAGACGVGKKVSDPPELWLEAVVGSPAWVFSKSSSVVNC